MAVQQVCLAGTLGGGIGVDHQTGAVTQISDFKNLEIFLVGRLDQARGPGRNIVFPVSELDL
jgi:hypothetical protein